MPDGTALQPSAIVPAAVSRVAVTLPIQSREEPLGETKFNAADGGPVVDRPRSWISYSEPRHGMSICARVVPEAPRVGTFCQGSQ